MKSNIICWKHSWLTIKSIFSNNTQHVNTSIFFLESIFNYHAKNQFMPCPCELFCSSGTITAPCFPDTTHFWQPFLAEAWLAGCPFTVPIGSDQWRNYLGSARGKLFLGAPRNVEVISVPCDHWHGEPKLPKPEKAPNGCAVKTQTGLTGIP